MHNGYWGNHHNNIHSKPGQGVGRFDVIKY